MGDVYPVQKPGSRSDQQATAPRGGPRGWVSTQSKYILAAGTSQGDFSQSNNHEKKSLQVEKMKVEFAMQEGLLIDSFYLDSGGLLTYIYFLITQNWLINLSLDSACHANEWMRILSVSDQPSGGKVILIFMTQLARHCGRTLLPLSFISPMGVSAQRKLLF